jgi:uncharacterized coiled-coil DUF342 family protein
MLGAMVLQKTLFDDNQHENHSEDFEKEVTPLDKLRSLEDKIATAIERVKTLKEEKAITDRKIQELEEMLDEKNQELQQLRAEKNLVKTQLETLLGEIESIEFE